MQFNSTDDNLYPIVKNESKERSRRNLFSIFVIELSAVASAVH